MFIGEAKFPQPQTLMTLLSRDGELAPSLFHRTHHSLAQDIGTATTHEVFFSDGRSKITVGQRCVVPTRIVQGGRGAKAHLSKGQKRWEQQGCEVLLDGREGQANWTMTFSKVVSVSTLGETAQLAPQECRNYPAHAGGGSWRY